MNEMYCWGRESINLCIKLYKLERWEVMLVECEVGK